MAIPLEVASGEATVDFASRRFDDYQPEETHERDRTLPRGFESIVSRLIRWRHTTFGRLATATMLALPATTAACSSGHEAVGNQPGIVNPNGGHGGGDAAPNRVIIGDAACYDGYEKLSAAQQEECNNAFEQFTLDQVNQLAPLDQARWAYTYHHMVTGGEDGERLSWTRPLENDKDAALVANNWITSYSQDVMRVAWMMQQTGQPDQQKLAEDPRTFAAFFGIGTTADSQPVQDAKWLVKTKPAGALNLNDYMRRIISTTELYASASQIHSTREKDGGYTLTFSSKHHSGSGTTFTVSYRPYFHLDNEGGKQVFRVFTDNQEATLVFGKPLLGMQVANA